MKISILRNVGQCLDDLLWLVYPVVCVSCERPLNMGEKCLCTGCRFRLPKTNFHLEADNPVIKHFWGKVKIEAAAAYFLFTKGEKVQHLIHQLKYGKRKDIGVFLGEIYGYDLKKQKLFLLLTSSSPFPCIRKNFASADTTRANVLPKG